LSSAGFSISDVKEPNGIKVDAPSGNRAFPVSSQPECPAAGGVYRAGIMSKQDANFLIFG
jgi:hypothetical protein